MMENLDWDRAHTIEEEDDTPESVLEENVPREGNKSSLSKNGSNRDSQVFMSTHANLPKLNFKIDTPSQQILRGYGKAQKQQNTSWQGPTSMIS